MRINFHTVIDLTYSLSPDIPGWPGDPNVRINAIATIEREGYFLQELMLGEHSGTHFGAAAHFHAGGRTVDTLDPGGLIRPAVMIDVRSAVTTDPDYRLDTEAILRWEEEHGPIPDGAVVLLCTGWGSRWENPPSYIAADPAHPLVKHTPGFALAAARFLAEERAVAGLGIDTHGIDAGGDLEYSVNSYWLQGERFHLENLANLHLLPPAGITLMIGALKIKGGSGAPARVLALVE